MGLMARITTVFKAKTNKVLDRVEDPRETLDLSYEEQLDNLTKMRRAVADVATSRKRIEIQLNQVTAQVDKLSEQAKAALVQNNEPLAREALTRREALTTQVKELETQHAQVAEQEEKLGDALQKLQVQVEAFRTKKETLKATYTAAEAQSEMNEAVSGISGSMADAGAALQRAQDKVAQMQARSGALDELIAAGTLTDLTTPHDDIQAQLDAASAGSSIDAELAALKAEVTGQGGAPS